MNNNEFYKNILNEEVKNFDLAIPVYSTYSLKDAIGDNGDWED